MEKIENEVRECSSLEVLAVYDTINVITGKWKLPILNALQYGKKRFNELEREIPKISPKMLSKHLKDLEENGMVTRSVQNAVPIIVEYELSKSGKSFSKLLDVLMEWGLQHRQSTISEIGK